MNETSNNSNVIKDFATPIAIVVAGALMGAGLYFSGTPVTPQNVGTTAGQPAPAAPAGLTLTQLAEQSGVDGDDFDECLAAGTFRQDVQDDVDNAVATGGRGTPWSILIGPGGKTYPINGALPQPAIEQLIELARAEAASTESASESAQTNLYTPVTEADHIRGAVNAPIKIVEYSDFDCAFCARFHQTMKAIVAKYPGDEVAWVYRHFPLEQLHPNAATVALASECVADLGGDEAFWTFADTYLAS